MSATLIVTVAGTWAHWHLIWIKGLRLYGICFSDVVIPHSVPISPVQSRIVMLEPFHEYFLPWVIQGRISQSAPNRHNMTITTFTHIDILGNSPSHSVKRPQPEDSAAAWELRFICRFTVPQSLPSRRR